MRRGSNIPLARAYLLVVLQDCRIDAAARRYCQRALAVMTRRKAVRRAPTRHKKITPEQRRKAWKLFGTDMTYHEIANETGIPNGGRVSEIFGGRRR